MLEYDIREFDEVTSTNDIVKDLAFDGEPEGVVVCARTQTAGYGRRGNAWESGPGSLYMSLLLRPESESAQIQTLPLVVAIAVRRAIASFLPEEAAAAVQVKWPNDVVISNNKDKVSGLSSSFSKICGISSELKHGAICVGIGVNIEKPEGEAQFKVEDSERNTPVYLCELAADGPCPSMKQVRDGVLEQLSQAYESWRQFGFAPFRSEYMQHFALTDARVRVEDALAFVGNSGMPVREVPCCVIRGVDDEGRLVAAACESGDTVKVTAGRVQMLHG